LLVNVDVKIMDGSLLLCFSCYSENNNYVNIVIVMPLVYVCECVFRCTFCIDDDNGSSLLLLSLLLVLVLIPFNGCFSR